MTTRLNSSVTELVNVHTRFRARIRFECTKEGWVYIKANGLLRLDGKVVRFSSGETMRYLTAGRHKLSAGRGQTIVRTIPEIMYYSYYKSFEQPGRVIRSWDDIKKPGIWDTYNVMVSDKDLEPCLEQLAEWKAKGGKWIRNAEVVTTYGVGPDKWHQMMTDPRTDGIIVDEFSTSDMAFFPAWAKIIRDIKDDPATTNKMLYGFVHHHPQEAYKPLLDELFACGYKVVPEAYYPEYETDEKAEAIITRWANESIFDWPAMYPGASLSQVNICLSPSDRGPVAGRWNRHSHIDFKVHLEKQFHALANSPAAIDLSGISFWRAHYVSEETMGHFNALVRHYLIEGHTEKLFDEPYVITDLKE